MWAAVEQVFPGYLGGAGAGGHWLFGQCWSRCLQVMWAVLEQVFTGQLGSVGAGVHWSFGQCWSRCSLVSWAVPRGHMSAVVVFSFLSLSSPPRYCVDLLRNDLVSK